MKYVLLMTLVVILAPSLWGQDQERYYRLKISKLDDLASELVPWVEKINGLDKKYFSGRELLVPRDTLAAQAYCPLPRFQAEYQKFDSVIVVDLDSSRLAVYKQGWLHFWAPITRGKKVGYTPRGTFKIQHKWRLIYSEKYGHVPMPYSLHLIGHVCIHQGPMVGRGASHGCLRLFKRHAIWLYNWARVGVPVIVK